jgi:mannosylglycerate hydrolase MGH1-like protein
MATSEQRRLDETHPHGSHPWRKWGCYVSERSWGTVREDYSAEGDAWNYLTHDKSRSKAYRWGEDGIAGLCDRYQTLIFSPAMWNGRDPILKERLFGVTPAEGNRGEDVKEYYFYLDATPTGSYMKLLYKYPQAEYPYGRLVDENRRRGGTGMEFELLDTGVFDDDRYFDVVVEYAKADCEDLCVKVEVFNRGRDDAEFHFVPTLWFRNTWGWGAVRGAQPEIRRGLNNPAWQELVADDSGRDPLAHLMADYRLGVRHLYAPPGGVALFTDNETNAELVYGPGNRSASPYTKDAFHRQIVNREDAVNPAGSGTKACLHYKACVAGRGSTTWVMRLSDRPVADPLFDIDQIIRQRRAEADEFYAAVHPPKASPDERLVQRQALAGMLWSRQIYLFDVNIWIDGDNPDAPPPPSRRNMRNRSWRHLNSMRILSMPDKWEYPWFAAWDLAFHAVALALVDPAFAKDTLWLMLFEQFQHPNGQIPSFEWEFSDLNPPVHAWACWRVYSREKQERGTGDRDFLEKCFHKLLINFAWWVNKVDSQGMNVFEGGFLGLDNITVVDRSLPWPHGAVLEQSDATGWMGFFCLHMMRIALELSHANRVYETLATKFFEHFTYIGGAMKKMGGRAYELWDEDDGFFYDVLRYGDGSFQKFRVRSLVGLVPLLAVEVLDAAKIEHLDMFLANLDWFVRNRADLVGMACYHTQRNGQKLEVLSIVDQQQLTRMLQHVWNEDEFLSPAGIRSLSRQHRDHPFTFGAGTVRYEPAEADTKLKGGNSNWRGPVWFPVGYLLIEALGKFGDAYGPAYKVDAPATRGAPMAPAEMGAEIANRMIGLFTRGEDGTRRIYGATARFQQDPYWRDCLLFHEYFHGDNGAGLGANHQTGWTGLVANLIDEWRR